MGHSKQNNETYRQRPFDENTEAVTEMIEEFEVKNDNCYPPSPT
jgi:hypothetical protein